MAKLEMRKSDPSLPDAVNLINELSSYLASKTGRDGRDSFEVADVIVPRSVFILAFENEQAVGCGAIRPFEDKICEVKRMYTRTHSLGVGTQILQELEKLAAEFKYERIWLETGVENQCAVKFYLRHGYKICENFGKYKGRPECVCFEKVLSEQ